jgi:hypothetical protein
MSVYPTRKARNIAAFLTLLSGFSHVAQLWFRETDGTALLTAAAGMIYLLLGLGLSGQSRFALWATTVTAAAGASAGRSLLSAGTSELLLRWHLLADLMVAMLCVYILYTTRDVDMD